MFFDILARELRCDLSQRHRFYQLLVHKYLRLIDLCKENVSEILPVIIHKFNHFDENIDGERIKHIVIENNMDGKRLQSLSLEEMMNAFAELNVVKSEWIKILQHIKNWENGFDKKQSVKGTECEETKDQSEEDDDKQMNVTGRNKSSEVELEIIEQIPKEDEDKNLKIMQRYSHDQNILLSENIQEEEEEETPPFDDPKPIKNCNTKQMIYLVKLICKESKNEKLKKNVQLFVDYFDKTNLNGSDFMSMKRREFAKAFTQFHGNKKLNGAALTLRAALLKYEEEFQTNNVQKEGLESNENEKRQSSLSQLANDPNLWNQENDEQKHEIEEKQDEEEKKPSPQKPTRGCRCRKRQNVIPNSMTEHRNDPYPYYIYKSIWSKSEDENLETFIDYTIRKVQSLVLWEDESDLSALYEDGINLDNPKHGFEARKTYFDFVGKVYEEVGRNRYFDRFVALNYKREIKVWQYANESDKVLTTNDQLIAALKCVNFKEFDLNKDYQIDFYEFHRLFRKLGYFVNKQKLELIFRQIDQNNDEKITRREYLLWKDQRGLLSLCRDATEEEKYDSSQFDHWWVYYNERDKIYEFDDKNRGENDRSFIAEFAQNSDNKHMKWAVYIHKLPKKQLQAKQFRNYVHCPKGYWVVLNDDKQENDQKITSKSIKKEMASKLALNAIFQLLHHYFVLNLDKKKQKKCKYDESPVRKLFCSHDDDEKGLVTKQKIAESDEKIIFCIEKTRYELTWWNQKGQNEANALSLVNITQGSKKRMSINYMRFDARPNAEWNWYDNDGSNYVSYDKAAVCEQLEVTFLSNIKQNFDPFGCQYLFNNALVTELKQSIGNKQKDYSLRFSFSPHNEEDSDWSDVIQNIEQITFNHREDRAPFPRNVKRFIDGRNSLDFLCRNSNSFVKKWQIEYRVYTNNQQLYFFAFIVSIVAMMKYIDLEFENQPVVLPLYVAPDIEDDVIQELIQRRDVNREQKIARVFKGYLIPPSDVFRAESDRNWHKNDEIRPSKTGILHKARVDVPEIAHKIEVYFQHERDFPDLYFTKEQAEFLRLLECVRKYALEYESGDSEYKLWPWYRNSLHSDYRECRDMLNYEELIYKFNFVKSWSISEMMNYLKTKTFKELIKTAKEKEKNHHSLVDSVPIRFERKFAAEMLLEPHTIARNINLLRNQLDSLISDIVHQAMEEHVDSIQKQMEKIHLNQTRSKVLEQDKARAIAEFCNKHIAEKLDSFWPSQLEKTNKSFFKKYNRLGCEDWDYSLLDDAYEFEQNIQNIHCLDVHQSEFPILMNFVYFFFVHSDKEIADRIKNRSSKYLSGEDHRWYREFLESFRQTPSWHTYDHDVLLLELALRNGIKSEKILQDLDGVNSTKYKIRLNCNDRKTMDDPFYEFRRFCSIQYNVYHSLKWITNVIVKNLSNAKFGGNLSLINIRIPDERDQPTYEMSGLLFSDYQRNVHLKSVQEQCQLINDPLPKRQQKLKKSTKKQSFCGGCRNKLGKMKRSCLKCVKKGAIEHQQPYSHIPLREIESESVDLDIEWEEGKDEVISRSVTRRHNYPQPKEIKPDPRRYGVQYSMREFNHRQRYNDPFIERDHNGELLHVLQTFNLFVYGKSLVECVVKQLQKLKRPSYWHILGEILNALPYPLAIEAINDEVIQDILRHAATPEIMKKICLRLMEGSSFRASACLSIADFFEDLSLKDMVQEEVWKEYSEQFEVMAYDQMSLIESDHLLFIILTIPLTQHDGKSLFQLSLEQKRIGFLNNDRINDIINHLYQIQFLSPEEEVRMKLFTNCELLRMLCFYPFKFYFCAYGHHKISAMSFVIYLMFVMAFASTRPISTQNIFEFNLPNVCEGIIWSCNIGYIFYEISELIDKGAKGYLNFGVSGRKNSLDILICLIWIFLLFLRIVLIIEEYSIDESAFADGVEKDINTILMETYVFLFGLQIILLTMRLLSVFSNTTYLGTLLRVIKLMLLEIMKFLVVFVIIMSGFVVGLWLISVANKCHYDDYADTEECDGYEVFSKYNSVIYIFQVWVGMGDLEGVVDGSIGILFMIGATLFGTLVLTNLLIALMSTEYEKTVETAKGEVIYNQAELTYDLATTNRMMPPPLNVVVIVIALIVDVLNFIFAMIRPSTWNIYAYINHQLFFNLQNFNIWYWEYDEYRPVRANKTKYRTQLDILKWYATGCWHDFIKRQKWCCPKGRNKESEGEMEINSHWRVHHKGCYGVLILKCEESASETYGGITMSQYCERYENKRRQKIEAKDKELLKRLTGNTLFCEFCYRPFLTSKVQEDLTTPYMALLDYISALTFVAIPIVWISLIVLFSLLAFKDYVLSLFKQTNGISNYKYTDFDKEYFPNQFKANNCHHKGSK